MPSELQHLWSIAQHYWPEMLALAGMTVLLAATAFNHWLYSIFNLPGTIAHELAHIAVGFVTNAHPASISLMPKKKKDGLYLGTASFRNLRYYNALLVTIAPLLLAPLAWWVFRHFVVPLRFTPVCIGSLYLCGNLVLACVPSTTDWKTGWRYSWPTLLLIVVVVGTWMWWEKTGGF